MHNQGQRELLNFWYSLWVKSFNQLLTTLWLFIYSQIAMLYMTLCGSIITWLCLEGGKEMRRKGKIINLNFSLVWIKRMRVKDLKAKCVILIFFNCFKIQNFLFFFHFLFYSYFKILLGRGLYVLSKHWSRKLQSFNQIYHVHQHINSNQIRYYQFKLVQYYQLSLIDLYILVSFWLLHF